MEKTKKYKLYKDGKKWVVGAIALAGFSFATTNIQQVSADTTTNSDPQAVQKTDTAQDDKQVQLTASSNVQSEQVTSDIPTSVVQNTTSDEAKTTIDKAQDTVKGNVDTAKGDGVEVTKGATQDITLNKDNAGSKSNEILNDLNKQDEAVKQATAIQQENNKAYADTTSSRDKTITQGQSDMNQATAKLQTSTDEAKKAGVIVVENHTIETPQYKDLTGLTGKSLVEASIYNETQYKMFVAKYADLMSKNAEANDLITKQYTKVHNAFLSELARVQKANADKKSAYDKLVLDRETAIKAAVEKGDQHYTGTYDLSGYYGSFLKGKVHYDYTYHWDATKNTFVITKVDMNFESVTPDKKGNGFWDAVYVQGPKFAIPQDSAKGNIQYGADLKEDGNTLWDEVKDPKYGVQFFLAQNNKTGETVTHQTLSSSVPYEAVQLENGEFEFARMISRNRQGDSSVPNSEYANWIVGNRILVQLNIPPVPEVPPYEQEPIAPDVSIITSDYYTVTVLPAPETPEQQKVSVHFYNVSVEPEPETSKVVAQSSVLPKTGSEANNGSLFLGVASTLASLGLLGAMRKKFKNQK